MFFTFLLFFLLFFLFSCFLLFHFLLLFLFLLFLLLTSNFKDLTFKLFNSGGKGLNTCSHRVGIVCAEGFHLCGLQKFIVKFALYQRVILLDSFYKKDTFFITSTKKVILLGSFHKGRNNSWCFGRKCIAWFLQREVPPLLIAYTRGFYIACSLLQEEAPGYWLTHLKKKCPRLVHYFSR